MRSHDFPTGFGVSEDITMKLSTVTLAISLTLFLALDATAQDPARRPFGDRGSATRGLNQGPANQPGRGRLANRDPSQIVASLMKEFDKDGDQKLNSNELTALLSSLRERRAAFGAGSGGRQPDSQGRPKLGRPEQRLPGADGQRRRLGGERRQSGRNTA